MSISCFQVQRHKMMLQNKHVIGKQLSRSLCFNFMHYVQKNHLCLAWLPVMSTNSNENCKRYYFQAFANISGKFTVRIRIFLENLLYITSLKIIMQK